MDLLCIHSYFASIKCLTFFLLLFSIDTENNSCSDHGFTQTPGHCESPQRQSPTSLRSQCVSPATLYQSALQHNAGNQGEKSVPPPECLNSIMSFFLVLLFLTFLVPRTVDL